MLIIGFCFFVINLLTSLATTYLLENARDIFKQIIYIFIKI